MMRVEWPTLGMIGVAYGGWLVAGVWLWPMAPSLALALMAVLTALQSSLVHECLHGHPTRNRRINEALVALPLSLVHPYRRYKATHMAHHDDERLTDPFDDPESYYRARWRHDTLPRWFQWVLRANNTLLGRVIMGPILGWAAFLYSEFRLIAKNARDVRLAWLLHLPALAAVLVLVWAMGIPLWIYFLGVVWPGLALIAMRTFAEHRWHAAPDGRTIIVESSPLAWLYLNNNLHIVHHRLPTAPWYDLPRLYAERRDEWQAINAGYVFPGYLALWRRWGLVPKEPVVHPVLRRTPDDGRLPL